jgi:hypothetical protein
MSKPPNPDNPSSEPEIIPPGHAEGETPRMRVFVGTHGSPLGIILVTLIVGLLSAAILMLLLGAFLFLLPLAVLVATGLVVAGLVRFYFQRGP